MELMGKVGGKAELVRLASCAGMTPTARTPLSQPDTWPYKEMVRYPGRLLHLFIASTIYPYPVYHLIVQAIRMLIYEYFMSLTSLAKV